MIVTTQQGHPVDVTRSGPGAYRVTPVGGGAVLGWIRRPQARGYGYRANAVYGLGLGENLPLATAASAVVADDQCRRRLHAGALKRTLARLAADRGAT